MPQIDGAIALPLVYTEKSWGVIHPPQEPASFLPGCDLIAIANNRRQQADKYRLQQ